VPADIVIQTTKFPTGRVNEAYEAGIATTGNATAITGTSVATGALPPGLTVTASDKLRISGTPTATGKFTFTLGITDTAGTTTSGSLSITITGHNQSPELYGGIPVQDQLKTQWPAQF